ncbi:SelT/SelW/SelH family protein [Swingsia samuiensis]|uniref:SelT/SelW/SelH family protein n=1 Tax=Swingsia samuiensis TaxID=1293412 RepID=A0A4Y6UKT0_9PROT|nr:SelT/SelW/SelH family protein [Swingsia samuiensis]QDH17238.1 SelT/SelW/SelH family protein [Swingsia samuiensis]
MDHQPELTNRPRIAIHYCTQCNWLMRSTWMAQELLSTFGEGLGEVVLIPSTGGMFEVYANNILVWERKRDDGFPSPKELKRRVRDIIAPTKPLGHIDRVDQKEKVSL